MGNLLLLLLTLLAACLSNVSGEIDQVVGVTITVNSPTHATITWQAVPQTVVKYQLTLKENPNGPTITHDIINGALRFEFTNAKSGTNYIARVRAVAANDKVGNWSTPGTVGMYGPKPIKLLQVPEIDINFVTLKWDVYADAGIPDYYKISYRNNDNGVVLYEPNVKSNQRSYKIQNLIGNTPYTIRIMAVKSNVNSSVVFQGLRTKLEYLRKIENVRATDITATTVTINWSKPAKLTYVEYYEIILDKGAESQTYQTSNNETIDHKTIKNLPPETAYYCRVRASINVNGNVYKGDWSNQIYFATILPDLKQITGVTFSEETATGALITWNAPSDYPIDIETYQILYYGEDKSPKTVNSGATKTQYRFTNLVSSMNYKFQVRAVDVRGRSSDYSTLANFQTIGPKPVSSMDITNITDNAARVKWTVDNILGHDSIILRLRNNENNEFQTDIVINRASAPTRVLTGLKPNNPYTVFLYTKKVHESSPISMGFRTGLPNSAVLPTKVKATHEDPLGTILLSCDYIFSTVKYRVKIQQKEGSKELTTTDYDVKTHVTTDTVNQRQTIRIKVKTGYTYDIQMASVVNDITVSEFSAIETVQIGGGRPATAITIFDKTENSFKVTWQSNYQLSGERLHYIVSLYFSSMKIERKETTYNYTPLLFNRNILSNTPYRITIKSRSPYDDKYGDVVDFAFVMPKGRPHAPLFVSPAPQDFSVTISWQPIPRRDDIAYYEIAIYEKDARSTNHTYRTSNGAVHAYTIASDLHPGKLYIAQVRGVASTSDKFNHEGVWSTQQLFSVNGIVGKQPGKVTPQLQENSVTITWTMSDASDVKYYEIQYKTDQQETTAKSTKAYNTYTITGLKSNMLYRIRVRAVTNKDQKGEWSSFIAVHTGEFGDGGSDNGVSSGAVAGIVIGVILLIAIVIIAYMFLRRHLRRMKFQRFQDRSVSFSKNGSANGHAAHYELDPAATKIRPDSGNYS